MKPSPCSPEIDGGRTSMASQPYHQLRHPAAQGLDLRTERRMSMVTVSSRMVTAWESRVMRLPSSCLNHCPSAGIGRHRDDPTAKTGPIYTCQRAYVISPLASSLRGGGSK